MLKPLVRLSLLLLLLARPAVADESPSSETLRARGHHKKVVGAALIIVGSVLDAATTALTFTGLARGGWSLSPRSATDNALLWTGVGAGFAVDSVLTAGIVIYCDGGQLMHKAIHEK
jgi:hypothetical protein